MTQLTGLSEKVFLDRYSLKDEAGNPVEKTPEEMWKRVARGIAEVETKETRAEWRKKFYEVMKDFKFLPGGRIFAGAGTNYDVTYYNCFVIPSPKDSRDGILDNLKSMIEIMARGGGVGLNLSSLRPRGARVKKVNGFSSGPINWAELYSLATKDIVQQGGSRRGALMLMLHDWHPDVEEFITVKQDLTRINGANLSVCLSDAFMEAVKNNGDWELCYPDLDDPKYDEIWDGDMIGWKKAGGRVKVHKVIKASYLWDMICTAAWRSAEPGLHFLERSNKRSNTHYFEKLIATNPCLPADAWIHTKQGPRQVRDLVGVQFIARVNGKDIPSSDLGFFKTGTKQLLSVTTKEGYALRLTEDHPVQKVEKHTRYKASYVWEKAGQLRIGDKISINNHSEKVFWNGKHTYGEGYLMGLLVGDGTLKEDKAVLSVWETNNKGAQSVMNHAYSLSQSMPHRSDFTGWMEVPQRAEHRLAFSYLRTLALELGMERNKKYITPSMEQASSEFSKGLLQGLFDADGSVQGSQQKGVSVRLAQSDKKLLEAVQRILLRFGVVSKIYLNRRVEGISVLPDGKGGKKDYKIKAQHELSISGENMLWFKNLIGFMDSSKKEKLEMLLKSYKRSYNREKFMVTVSSISQDGVEDVYDAQIPGLHAFDANGFYVHNCGEQPLSAWAVCNLGAMNLTAYVKDGKFDYDSFGTDVKIATRFLDNVIDSTYYFLKENEQCAKDIRRTGLGIMGLGDALIMMKLRYGAEESLPTIEKIFKTLRDNAYIASSDIAKEKGAFPKFEAEKYLQGHHIKALPKAIREKIEKDGIRNAVLLTIAPTGTTSLLANTTSGIEPVYEFEFIRKSRLGIDKLYHPLYDEWRRQNPDEKRPDYFVSANDLTPMDHAKVQAIAQGYIDSSISKTVNAPNNHTVDDVKDLYMAAYDMGMKGITYMRDGSRVGVLQREEKKEEKKEEPVVQKAAPILRRPVVMRGLTYKTQTPLGDAFITINSDDNGNPFEVFVTIGKLGSDVAAMADALGRIISLTLRLQSPVEPRERVRQIIAQLSGIGGMRSIGFGQNRVRSVPDAMAKVFAEEFSFKVNGRVVDAPKAPIQADALPALDTSTTVSVPVTDAPALNGAATNGASNGAAAISMSNGAGTHGTMPQSLADVYGQKQAVLEQPTQVEQLPLEAEPNVETHSHADVCPQCGVASFVHEEGCSKCYSCGHAEC